MDIRHTKKRSIEAPQKPLTKPVGTKHIPPKRPSAVLPKKRRRTREAFRKAFIRHAIVGVNLVIVGLAIFVVVTNSDGNAANYSAASKNEEATNPLDRVSAADIAVNVARLAGVSEESAVTNYADTVNSELETFSAHGDVAYAPQIMSADIKTLADIKEYYTVEGDTISGLAGRFGVTSDSIKWSNDLLNDALQPGIKLYIPPMNGIIYVVHSGDTPEKLAGLYRVPVGQIIAFNDAEVSGLVPGMRIFIPNGQKPAPVFSFYARYGNNGYDAGYCTYYAAAKSGAPPGWGHARTWARYAAQTPGWMVDKVPVKGSIAQTDRISAWGHVAIVEDVKQEGGIYYIKYSDMNGIAGYNRVGYSGWTDATMFQNYIYRIQ